jgi:protein gp37
MSESGRFSDPISQFVASRSSDRSEGWPENPAPDGWYDVAWNPTVGCSAVSPACDHCDALRAAVQLARMRGRTGADYAGLTRPEAGLPVWTGEIRLRDDLLTWPLLRSNPRRILVDAMSDLFHENLGTPAIDKLHAVMAVAHWHLFLVLSKRAERLAAYYRDPQTPRRIALEAEMLAATLPPSPPTGPIRGRGATARRLRAAGLSRIRRAASGAPIGLDPWPLPNLWPGVSVEDAAGMARISHLLATPATRRWVCLEPLLGPVRPDAVPVGDAYFDALRGGHYQRDRHGRVIAVAGPPWPPLDWVIVGGEIGAAARPMQPDWLRGVRDRCSAAGVPFFFKQWGEWVPGLGNGVERPMVRIGRRAAGRLLDGRDWSAVPGSMPRR